MSGGEVSRKREEPVQSLRRVVGGEVTEMKGRGTFAKKPFMAGVTGPLTCKTRSPTQQGGSFSDGRDLKLSSTVEGADF